MKKISLSQGKVALIDNEDYKRVGQRRWYANCKGAQWYAGGKIRQKDGRWIDQYMHRVIMNAQPGQEIDHKNGDGLDNRRANLRFATRSENKRNRSKPKWKNVSSRFKGVSWLKQNRKWEAYIQENGRKRYLGLFTVEHEAALAYDRAAKEFFGEFARPNFLLEKEKCRK